MPPAKKSPPAKKITPRKAPPQIKKTVASARRLASLGQWLKGTRLAFAVAALASFQWASSTFIPEWPSAGRITGQLTGHLLAHADAPLLREVLIRVGLPPDDAWGNAVGFANCPRFFPAGAPPQLPQAKGRELCFSAFAVLHDGSRKTPVYVAERLNRKLLQQAQGLPRTDRFFADARLPMAERAELEDYKGSGLARGHMAPAADMHNADAMAQSFSLANMVPQDHTQNAGPWAEVEKATRSYVMRAQGDVHVLTGPVFEGRTRTIGPGKVHVPSHIFKLVYDATTGRSWVHLQPNSPGARMGAPISYAEFVRRTGMPLLSAVDGSRMH